MKPSLILIQDTRRIKINKTYPIKLRITFNRKQRYFSTGIDLKEGEWEVLNNAHRLQKEQKTLREKLIGMQGKAQGIIDDMKFFSFVTFEKEFYQKRSPIGSLFQLYTDYIENLKRQGRVGTAYSYISSQNSLKLFKSKIDFADITPDFLDEYEKWMLNEENSLTTVGIYLRSLRAILNDAIERGLMIKDAYPFGKRKYQIPAGRNVKKALALDDVRKIFEYSAVEGTTTQKARDFWMFSYLCNGINIKDIALLKFKNLKGDNIEFVRAKTERSAKTNQKVISIFLLPEAKEIINRWAVKERLPNNYIFPIVEKGMTSEKEFAVIHQFTKTVNKYIQRIADDLKLEKHVTTYTARHSFSTVLKRSGASTEFIGEALGHSNKKTTENYLDSFEQETKMEFAKKLLEFKR
jgi:integrase/recombinase XerD